MKCYTVNSRMPRSAFDKLINFREKKNHHQRPYLPGHQRQQRPMVGTRKKKFQDQSQRVHQSLLVQRAGADSGAIERVRLQEQIFELPDRVRHLLLNKSQMRSEPWTM